MRHWQDKGKRRVWRWILLVYSLVASALTIYGLFYGSNGYPILLVICFVGSTVFLLIFRRLAGTELILILAFILVPTLPNAFSETIFNDMAAGRYAVQYEILGAPVHRIVEESGLTRYYRAYVSKELPPPRWYRDSTDIILFLPVHLDRFGPSLSIVGHEFQQVFDQWKPSEEMKAHIIKTFFEINERSYRTSADAITYAKAVSTLYDEKNGKVTMSDLANPDTMIKEETKRQEERR
jgi:hypothetical protein